MGGLAIDRSGATAIQGLYAAGECVGGIHGANRMGGNALSEALVFGALAGREAARYAQSPVPSSGLDPLIKEWIKRRINGFQDKKKAPQSYGPLRREVEQILWEQVGIIRESAGLEAAIARLDRLRETHRQFNLDNPKGFPYAWEEGNALLIGRAIAAAALKRTESRGAHFRSDFPRENPDWLGHLYVRMENGLPEVVRFEKVTPMEIRNKHEGPKVK
jgi:succinate dehydrogenase/fumarate reductase flavoprotein subunit